MISESFERYGLLYTIHDSPRPCTASFQGTFARTSGRVRTSKTIVIVHISYAGQGLRCNSQEKAIPPTSIKKNQSVQDREAPLSYERHPATAKQGTKVTDRSGKNAGKATLSAMSSLGLCGVLIGMWTGIGSIQPREERKACLSQIGRSAVRELTSPVVRCYETSLPQKAIKEHLSPSGEERSGSAVWSTDMEGAECL